MKLLIGVDQHGKSLKKIVDVDVVLIAGDFAKGDKLREVVFGNGSIEDAKKEVIDSAKDFLKDLPRGSIITSGNVEKLCLNSVSILAEELGHHFLDNKIIDINEIKILGIPFFMEEEWTRNTYPDNKDKINRARKEEAAVKTLLDDNNNADIVLSHLPPYGILDSNPNPPKFIPKNYSKNCGSKLLLEYIKKNQPKLVVCGHIHIPGEEKIGSTRVINPGEEKIISFP